MNTNDVEYQCCICLSKNSEINIPVKINPDILVDCDCKQNYNNNNNLFCLSCIEDWLDPFNYKTNKFIKFITTGKCLFCRKAFKNNYKINDICSINHDILQILDNMKKELNCPRCNILINSRTDLILHLKNECPQKIIECQNCTDYFNLNTIKRHLKNDKRCINNIFKQCFTCKQNISLMLYSKHILDCPEQIIQCSYCDEVLVKKNIKEHKCEYNKLKRKILILKEINKNLISFNQEKNFQFRFQCYNLKLFLKDNILTPPTIDEINLQINDIFQFSTTFIDLTLLKEPDYINLPKYNMHYLT